MELAFLCCVLGFVYYGLMYKRKYRALPNTMYLFLFCLYTLVLWGMDLGLMFQPYIGGIWSGISGVRR